jgi:signal transduction histidine kinase/CheY-like chemotaxis protein
MKHQFETPTIRSHKFSVSISFLRILLLIIITLAGITSGGLSYYFIRSYQTKTEIESFKEISQNHFGGVQDSFGAQFQASFQVATLLSWTCPSESNWPNCMISSREFVSRTKYLSSLSETPLFFVSPIVFPNKRDSFEEFALDYYKTDAGYPNGTGYSAFGPGIFDPNDLSGNVKSPNHTDPSTSKHDILVPVLYSSVLSKSYFLANTYTDSLLKPSIDNTLDCLNVTSPHNEPTPCSSITDFPHPAMTNLSAILTPIFPADQPDAVVGFVGALFSWEKLISSSKTPGFNFQCSVKSSTSPTARTYTIESGIAHESAEITRYPPSADHFRHQLQHSFILNIQGISSSDANYTVTYYSSPDDKLSVTSAVIACVCCVGVTLLISIIFIGFNSLMNIAALETDNLLNSKRTFVRFVSHEIRCDTDHTTLPSLLPHLFFLFRTPLNTISLSLRLVSENLLTLKKLHESPNNDNYPAETLIQLTNLLNDCLELVDDLHESSAVAVTTLNDLINYDKIETKTFTIEEKDVKIWSVLEKTVSPMTLQAKEKNIHLHLSTQLSNPPLSSNETVNLENLRVIGDSIKLGQVIRNLVSNAFKFTPRDGTVKISGTGLSSLSSTHRPLAPAAQYEPLVLEIPVTSPSRLFGPRDYLPSHHETISVNPPIGHVIIRVTDSGPGLSKDQQSALFRQGVQFNANQLQGGQGSGLGLWISKEIVNLHHGHIRVTSAGLGCGSTFEVKLPVVLREMDSVAESTFSRAPNAVRGCPEVLNDPPSLGHVLVVDDVPSNRKIVSRLLKSKGFICHEAENGQECVDMVLAGEHPYKFILLDYEMPVLNGPSAARQLRDQKCDLLIVGVTGNVLPEDKAHFISQGANIVLAKPLDLDVLFSEYENYQNSLSLC